VRAEGGWRRAVDLQGVYGMESYQNKVRAKRLFFFLALLLAVQCSAVLVRSLFLVIIVVVAAEAPCCMR
jgi:hypothetical protein